MGFLLDKCSFSSLDEKVIDICRSFSCGNADLDDFFQHDAPLYSRQMLGKSYCFRLDEDPSVIVCAFTLSNDSIRVDMLPNSREKKVQKDIPRSKQLRRYPGVFSTESQEAENTGFEKDTKLRTRLMYFDLASLVNHVHCQRGM